MLPVTSSVCCSADLHPHHGRRGSAAASSRRRIVSSSALAALARRPGRRRDDDTTGFKWLARAGGEELPFAYEEALGYAVGLRFVRDKDGISAALAVAELAAALKRSGRTLLDRLDELAVEIRAFCHQAACRSARPTPAPAPGRSSCC